MLRRIPTTTDGKPVERLQESVRVNKPFKPPSFAKSALREQPQRKRKRTSYKDAQASDDDSDDGNPKKKRKRGEKDGGYGEEMDLSGNDIKRFPKYVAKPFETVGTKRFSIPCMMNLKGEVIPTTPTNVSLGIRPQALLIPRPLHDPMEDHAIVLYDPTIDDRETEEERREREKEEAREKALKEAEEKNKGLYNPHKSLKKLLGEDQKKQQKTQKVAVVLAPQLTKVLRPHQVEGVKVSAVVHMY